MAKGSLEILCEAAKFFDIPAALACETWQIGTAIQKPP